MTNSTEPTEPTRKKLLTPVNFTYSESRVTYMGQPCYEIKQRIVWKGSLRTVALHIVTTEEAAISECERLQHQHKLTQDQRFPTNG